MPVLAPSFPQDIDSLVLIIKRADSALKELDIDYSLFYENFNVIRSDIRNFLLDAYYNEDIVDQELNVLSKHQHQQAGTGHTNTYTYNAVAQSVLRNSYIFLSLHKKYPGYILAPNHAEFTKNFVGGIYAEIRIIYASLTSYMALYGTCLDQTGFSGVYPKMTVNDLMISGTMHGTSYGPQQCPPVTYTMGTYSQLNPGQKWTYNMKTVQPTHTPTHTEYEPVYMLDVGYGDIPDAFWEGIIMPAIKDSDYKSALVQLRDDLRATIKSSKSCVIL